MSEIWKDITGYENLYMVSSAGRIKSVDRYVKNRNGVALKKGKILAPAKIDKTQYLKVSLWKNNKQKTFLVHRLVAEAFLEKNSEKTQVNHIDENPQNNNVENLEWCTPSYNVNFGTRNDRAALKKKENTVDGKEIAQLDMNGNVVQRFSSAKKAAEYIGGDNSAICKCANGVTKTSYGFIWKWL